MKKHIDLSVLSWQGSLSLASCDDFRQHRVYRSRNDESFLDSDAAVNWPPTSPLYSYVWNNFNDKGLLQHGRWPTNSLTTRWSDYIFPYTNFTEQPSRQALRYSWNVHLLRSSSVPNNRHQPHPEILAERSSPDATAQDPGA